MISLPTVQQAAFGLPVQIYYSELGLRMFSLHGGLNNARIRGAADPVPLQVGGPNRRGADSFVACQKAKKQREPLLLYTWVSP